MLPTPSLRRWDSQLYGQQVIPFVDMTVKGWLWYQGENNMGGTYGNAAAGVGYGCEQLELVRGWRAAWSAVPNTTDPLAPFGLVTLASSGESKRLGGGGLLWRLLAVVALGGGRLCNDV